MQREISAGGVVFRRKDKKIEVLVIKDSYGKLAFPKGHIEKGETKEQAALRETLEETNLEELKPIKELGTISFWYTFEGQRIHKTIHFFLFELLDSDIEPTPQWEIQGGEWVLLEKLQALEIYKDLKPIINKTVKSINEIKNL